jgi:hypothetical protein
MQVLHLFNFELVIIGIAVSYKSIQSLKLIIMYLYKLKEKILHKFDLYQLILHCNMKYYT